MANAQNAQPKKGENRRAAVLRNLRAGCTISAACAAANVGRRTFYEWKAEDIGFAENVELAQGAAAQEIEDTLFQCARKALHDPKYQTSLIFLCKARLGWRDNGDPPRGDVAPDGVSEDLNPDVMNDDQLERYIGSLERLAGVAEEA